MERSIVRSDVKAASTTNCARLCALWQTGSPAIAGGLRGGWGAITVLRRSRNPDDQCNDQQDSDDSPNNSSVHAFDRSTSGHSAQRVISGGYAEFAVTNHWVDRNTARRPPQHQPGPCTGSRGSGSGRLSAGGCQGNDGGAVWARRSLTRGIYCDRRTVCSRARQALWRFWVFW